MTGFQQDFSQLDILNVAHSLKAILGSHEPLFTFALYDALIDDYRNKPATVRTEILIRRLQSLPVSAICMNHPARDSLCEKYLRMIIFLEYILLMPLF